MASLQQPIKTTSVGLQTDETPEPHIMKMLEQTQKLWTDIQRRENVQSDDPPSKSSKNQPIFDADQMREAVQELHVINEKYQRYLKQFYHL